MEFLLYLIFFGIVSGALVLANYYFKLLFLSGRESFERLELVDWIRIVPDELIKLLESNGSLQYGAIAFFFPPLYPTFGRCSAESSVPLIIPTRLETISFFRFYYL